MGNLDEQIKTFTSEIVNRSKNVADIKKGVYDYKCFLINSKLITKKSEIATWLDSVIQYSNIIGALKESFKEVDLDSCLKAIVIIQTGNSEVEEDPKHYGHFHQDTSSSCGVSQTSDSCGTSRSRVYSSSCGGSTPTYTNRC